jgi:predicted NAD-dependent protein-ADP-ribosyltransferase YbiA (DUF1768 family)
MSESVERARGDVRVDEGMWVKMRGAALSIATRTRLEQDAQLKVVLYNTKGAYLLHEARGTAAERILQNDLGVLYMRLRDT